MKAAVKRRPSSKSDATIRGMVDTYAPPIRLLAKIGSILVHIDEGLSEKGHEFDLAAIKALMGDREVQEWLDSMQRKGFLPVKR